MAYSYCVWMVSCISERFVTALSLTSRERLLITGCFGSIMRSLHVRDHRGVVLWCVVGVPRNSSLLQVDRTRPASPLRLLGCAPSPLAKPLLH